MPLATAIAVMGHLPCFALATALAPMVLIWLTSVGVNPIPSMPYVAAGHTPVLYSALALLFTLFNCPTLWALILACATLFLMVPVALLLPPV
eukprot:2369275-Karenia_brevis.AAC.1